ncbi:hypothetical protein GCM10009687_06500 [Asanoa iriomotensis]|uniref:Immunity protein Imm5 domain-containing protein n=1 Tax=Asanoa iriomotensis TaxID=234613 RepID=A0ABQ4C1N1_9ACTN|nr:hypothetical protein Air01nite_27960 [Asanoa iriomotensis]
MWTGRFHDLLPFAAPVQEATSSRPELALTPDPIELDRLATLLDNRMRTAPDAFPAVAAGLACWATNRDLLRGHLTFPDGAEEGEVDSEDWEASYFASIALAGGAVWEKAADPTRRRAFWLWYLRDAVPASYAV